MRQDTGQDGALPASQAGLSPTVEPSAMNIEATLHQFGKATRSLPRRSTELRDLALAAARASELLGDVYHGFVASEAECVLRETRATDTRQALLDHLLNHHGMTAAEVKRMKEVL
jgi:hypothetical protein